MKKAPHLLAAAIALCTILLLAVWGNFFARRQENLFVHALAATKSNQAYNGSAFQRAASRYPDLLLIYGSSELTQGDPRYQSRAFFRKYPTDFMVFQVAKPAANALTIAQSLAALGSDLRGKKVVISFTPSLFLLPMLSQEYYNGNFSRLHAYELIFSPTLSRAVRQAAARRMLDYPDSLAEDALLHFALQHSAEDAPLDNILLAFSWPLGRLQTTLIRQQDHFASLNELTEKRLDSNIYPAPAKIDWQGLLQKAREEQAPFSNNNPYGVDNVFWEQEYKASFDQPIAPGSGDAEFLTSLENSKEWQDFDLLLRVLTELGARPLLISRPLNAPFLEALGISRRAQSVYYQKLTAAVASYPVTLVDFHTLDGDKTFSVDRTSHPSLAGWIYVNQALDAFYHDLRQP
ncbi:MAG: D-alanyl-lipoteichoic acid biosynthesis protein DltD [Anaerolineae bacterium CG_4_9_14_3_um_filter_57_17]|nr:D-alanyl-lipoteichoic acid biosynthesis protein DltD [bacterium]NCT21501.1 D-alanyl-lipoteichoic acid biosynthesis protein DltD [bacterium]OIO86637.1 MAG: D-alanyl-lipoteichoic acid biosynthesis protein DltD [Anaerolineae bacterium CG2_30_57_67]PJB64905.1 MAG: D-alanyl-lipoteichoic acid biosynthesis protein DltD [Anaerolineae bacterium CG_4_9_14_3_um_filter_57_17]